MGRTDTSRSCPSPPARQVAGRPVVGQPDAVGGPPQVHRGHPSRETTLTESLGQTPPATSAHVRIPALWAGGSADLRGFSRADRLGWWGSRITVREAIAARVEADLRREGPRSDGSTSRRRLRCCSHIAQPHGRSTRLEVIAGSWDDPSRKWWQGSIRIRWCRSHVDGPGVSLGTCWRTSGRVRPSTSGTYVVVLAWAGGHRTVTSPAMSGWGVQ
jgi:hypothetical protein